MSAGAACVCPSKFIVLFKAPTKAATRARIDFCAPRKYLPSSRTPMLRLIAPPPQREKGLRGVLCLIKYLLRPSNLMVEGVAVRKLFLPAC